MFPRYCSVTMIFLLACFKAYPSVSFILFQKGFERLSYMWLIIWCGRVRRHPTLNMEFLDTVGDPKLARPTSSSLSPSLFIRHNHTQNITRTYPSSVIAQALGSLPTSTTAVPCLWPATFVCYQPTMDLFLSALFTDSAPVGTTFIVLFGRVRHLSNFGW